MPHPHLPTCPCHSGKTYAACCEPYHRGKPPENALILMRSRYAAYALGLADYIIATQIPPPDRQTILEFCKTTSFDNLEILDFQDGKTVATVTFKAILSKDNQDTSFIEKSSFEKRGSQWFYLAIVK